MLDDNQKQQDPSSKVQVTLAVIALVGTLSGAIITNWDKIFLQNSVTQSSPSPNSSLGIPSSTSVNGKYSTLTGIIECSNDYATYGEFADYGYSKGGKWCGKDAPAGYWVWSNPNWYIWRDKK